MKTIGVLTSGGDAPGMNAAIRAVVRTGCESGMRVLGIRRGYSGLINGDMVEMDLRSVSDIIHRGGTMLYTARCPEFKTEEGIQKAVDVCHETGMEGIVVIGGDGSFRGARDLSLHGIPCVAMPGTIDNDVACCDYTVGYDTAMNTIMDMVDRIRDTTESHDRCSVVEVMGRRAGYLALNAGIAVGATSILIPEVPYDLSAMSSSGCAVHKKPARSILSLSWPRASAAWKRWQNGLKRQLAWKAAHQCSAMCSVAVPPRCVIVWLQAIWAIIAFASWKRGLVTAWLQCRRRRSWILISMKP